jgi:hypothetical protein
MATRRSPTQAIGTLVVMLLILAAVALMVTIVLIAVGESGGAIATGIFFVLLVGAAGIDALISARKVATHGGDAKAVDADSADAVPSIVQSREEPIGVSSDVHTDLNPHDLPVDHPGRPEAKERAGFERDG